MPSSENSTDDRAAREFVISRVFDAPRALVFQAWIDPRQMTHWWGPRDFTNPICELDARPGGAYRIVMRSPDGHEYPIRGVFLEVVASERLVMTMDVSGHPPEWHDLVNPNRARREDDAVGQMVQTVTFEDLRGKTKLTVRTLFNSVAIRDAMVALGMTEGWSQSLDRLSDLLARA